MKVQLLALSFPLILSSCAAHQIHSYNDALVNFLSAKSTAKQDPDSYETALASLDSLAREADAAADDDDKDLNKIALYRISATAAWQSNQNDEVFRVADKGSILCAKNNNDNAAPRDCAMLDVIPLLAAIDANTDAYNILEAKVTSTAMDERESLYGSATVELFNSAARGMTLFLDKRQKTNIMVSDSYRKHIDENVETAAGIFDETYALLRITHNIDTGNNGANSARTAANCKVIIIKRMLHDNSLDAAADQLRPEDRDAICQ